MSRHVRRALIVGIDDYPSSPLAGCVNDAKRMEKALSRNYDGKLNFQCELLISPPGTVTRAELRKSLIKLFTNNADVVFFHYSGHGLLNGLGGYLVTQDAQLYDVGIAMGEVLSMANDSKAEHVFITLDCCHSGAFGSISDIGADKLILREGVSIITATRSSQNSLEVGGAGIFTSLLVDALDDGASGLLGEVTTASIYAYIENALGAWDQRPLFKSNVSTFLTIREVKPKIDRKLLLKIVQYFPLPAEEFKLTREYEKTDASCEPAKIQIFDDLIKLKNVGLVEPVDEEHMYFAAINEKSCQLTMMGRYYWRLVKENKL